MLQSPNFRAIAVNPLRAVLVRREPSRLSRAVAAGRIRQIRGGEDPQSEAMTSSLHPSTRSCTLKKPKGEEVERGDECSKVGGIWKPRVYNPPSYPKGFVYEPANPDYSFLLSEGSDQGNSSPVGFVLCDYCGDEHPDFSVIVCPKKLCTTCFMPGHSPVRCPFLVRLPRGADYDRVQYHVVCECGELYFDEKKCVCTKCGGRRTTRLKLKECIVCNTLAQHCSEECPNDKIGAAEYRARRDYVRSHLPI